MMLVMMMTTMQFLLFLLLGVAADNDNNDNLWRHVDSGSEGSQMSLLLASALLLFDVGGSVVALDVSIA